MQNYLQKTLMILAPFLGSTASYASDISVALSLFPQETWKARASVYWHLAERSSLYLGLAPTAYGYKDAEGDRKSTIGSNGVLGYGYVGQLGNGHLYELASQIGVETFRDRRSSSSKSHSIGFFGAELGYRYVTSGAGVYGQAGLGAEIRMIKDPDAVYAGDRKIQQFNVYPYLRVGF